LKEPDGCSASHFSQTVLPLRTLSGLDCSKGDTMWSGMQDLFYPETLEGHCIRSLTSLRFR
jgi:hypothetical protein